MMRCLLTRCRKISSCCKRRPKLTKPASVFFEAHQKAHPRGDPRRFVRWIQLREGRFSPVDHIDQVRSELLRFDHGKYANVQLFNDAFNSLLAQVAGPMDIVSDPLLVTAYRDALPNGIRRKFALYGCAANDHARVARRRYTAGGCVEMAEANVTCDVASASTLSK